MLCNANDLPEDLLSLIFSFLDKKSRQACICTCKYWLLASRKILLGCGTKKGQQWKNSFRKIYQNENKEQVWNTTKFNKVWTNHSERIEVKDFERGIAVRTSKSQGRTLTKTNQQNANHEIFTAETHKAFQNNDDGVTRNNEEEVPKESFMPANDSVVVLEFQNHDGAGDKGYTMKLQTRFFCSRLLLYYFILLMLFNMWLFV